MITGNAQTEWHTDERTDKAKFNSPFRVKAENNIQHGNKENYK